MERSTPAAHRCPSPKECPFGPKVDGYTCLKAFEVTEPPEVEGGKPGKRCFCSDAYVSNQTMKQILTMQVAGASGRGPRLVVPRVMPGPPPGPQKEE